MFRSAKFSAVLGVALILGHASVASGDAASDRKLASQLQQSLPTLVVNEQYRNLSQATMKLADARTRLGDTPAACKALSQSLESYRMALVKETGVQDEAASAVNDDSSGMADIRARFGCTRV